MAIDCPASLKRQHCVLWLDGARMAWRTRSCRGEVAVPADCAPGCLRARATLCTVSLDEQAVNVGAAATPAAARSSCLLDGSWDALIRGSLMGVTRQPCPIRSNRSVRDRTLRGRCAVVHLRGGIRSRWRAASRMHSSRDLPGALRTGPASVAPAAHCPHHGRQPAARQIAGARRWKSA